MSEREKAQSTQLFLMGRSKCVLGFDSLLAFCCLLGCFESRTKSRCCCRRLYGKRPVERGGPSKKPYHIAAQANIVAREAGGKKRARAQTFAGCALLEGKSKHEPIRFSFNDQSSLFSLFFHARDLRKKRGTKAGIAAQTAPLEPTKNYVAYLQYDTQK